MVPDYIMESTSKGQVVLLFWHACTMCSCVLFVPVPVPVPQVNFFFCHVCCACSLPHPFQKHLFSPFSVFQYICVHHSFLSFHSFTFAFSFSSPTVLDTHSQPSGTANNRLSNPCTLELHTSGHTSPCYFAFLSYFHPNFVDLLSVD